MTIGVEQFLPFLKPVLDGLRSVGDWYKRLRRPKHGMVIPKQTLILLPSASGGPYALHWGLGNAGNVQGMQIGGRLQATNTSSYGVRCSGLKLLKPKGVELFTQHLSVLDPETGTSSSIVMIPSRSIGELSFLFFVTPVTATPGKTLVASIAVVDQFGNEHSLRNLQFKYLGPEPSAANNK